MTPIETTMIICALWWSMEGPRECLDHDKNVHIHRKRKVELVCCELLCYRDLRQCENIIKTSNGTDNHNGMKAEELNNYFSVK